jgi:endoglucanase
MWKIAVTAALAIGTVWAFSLPERVETRAVPETQFRRGVNILGYDPMWENPARVRFQKKHFAEIRRTGFDFVRVNLFVFKHMDDQDAIDPAWLNRLDWVVRNAKGAGLGVILDEHDFRGCREDPSACRVKLAAVWRQLAARYRTEPSTVAFELLNEPPQNLEAEGWNAMISELLAIIRATNPQRTIIVGPRGDNLVELPNFRLPPNDRHLMVTFHYYEPFRFTHQGASFSKIKDVHGVLWGSTADRQHLRMQFDQVSGWSWTHQRPILLGEFAVYDKSGIPMAQRSQYLAAVTCEAERRGFGWAYWQFDSDFVLWDMQRDAWVEPIKDALLHGSSSASC